MLSIGEFSKICEVSAKTLRYYDEIGLIHPDDINPDNGYRYYSIHQLKNMLFINRLKGYQFSLDEIKDIMETKDDAHEERLHAALNRKRQEIEEQRNALDFKLQQISQDIFKVEQGVHLMAYLDQIEVQLVDTEPLNILYVRQILSRDHYSEGFGLYFSRLYVRIATEKLTLLGTPMTIYHSAEYNPSGNDTEFAIPIQEAVKGTRDLPVAFVQNRYTRGRIPD